MSRGCLGTNCFGSKREKFLSEGNCMELMFRETVQGEISREHGGCPDLHAGLQANTKTDSF